MKSGWLDNRLNLNFALFRMDYDDLQVRLGCVNCGPGGIPLRFLSNAGTAEGEGFEVDLVALPTASLRFTAGIGYMDTVYDDLEDVEDQRRGGFFDAGGKTLPLAPEWTVNVSAQHTAALPGGMLTSRLDLSYVDDRFSDGSFHNHPDDVLPSQTLLGARVGYRPASDNWGIALWAKNLTDDDSEVYRAFGTGFLPFWHEQGAVPATQDFWRDAGPVLLTPATANGPPPWPSRPRRSSMRSASNTGTGTSPCSPT